MKKRSSDERNEVWIRSAIYTGQIKRGKCFAINLDEYFNREERGDSVNDDACKQGKKGTE